MSYLLFQTTILVVFLFENDAIRQLPHNTNAEKYEVLTNGNHGETVTQTKVIIGAAATTNEKS